jgi:hypothetical protein
LVSQPDPTGESPVTTAKPLARYSAVEGALASGFATAELHHQRGHDPLLSSRTPVRLSRRGCSFQFSRPDSARLTHPRQDSSLNSMPLFLLRYRGPDHEVIGLTIVEALALTRRRRGISGNETT